MIRRQQVTSDGSSGAHDFAVRMDSSTFRDFSPGKFNLSKFSESISDFIKKLKISQSTAIHIDPLDGGEASLANRCYIQGAQIRAQAIVAELGLSKVRTLASMVRDFGLVVERLEINDRILLGLVESTIESRSSLIYTLSDLSSSALYSASTALWAVPGLGAAYGAAAYAGGAFFDYISCNVRSSSLRTDLANARNLILENCVSSIIHDGLARSMERSDDPDSNIEAVSSWLSNNNESIHRSETVLGVSSASRRSFEFFGFPSRPDVLGVSCPVVDRQGSVMLISIVFDMSAGRCRLFRGNISGAVHLRESQLYSILGNSRSKQALLSSSLPMMASDSIIESRMEALSSKPFKLTGVSEVDRSLIHAFLQSGSSDYPSL